MERKPRLYAASSVQTHLKILVRKSVRKYTITILPTAPDQVMPFGSHFEPNATENEP